MDTPQPNYTLLFDGGWSPRESYGSFAYTPGEPTTKQPHAFLVVGHRLPVLAATHTMAEYQAMILGLRFLGWLIETCRTQLIGQDGRFEWLEIIGDNQTVISQLRGDMNPIGPIIQNQYRLAETERVKLLRFFERITYRHVPRSVCQSVFHH